MIFREAKPGDIQQIQIVRNAVKENMLSNPALVTDKDCEEFLMIRGKGWICEINGNVVGFSIVDMKERNVWALFVHPDHEAKGIGKRLHDRMMNWYFDQTKDTIWLSTAPGTRAKAFISTGDGKKWGNTALKK